MGGEKMIMGEVINQIPWSEMHWFVAGLILLTITFRKIGIVIGNKTLTFKLEIEKEKGPQKSDPKDKDIK